MLVLGSLGMTPSEGPNWSEQAFGPQGFWPSKAAPRGL